MPRKRYPTDLTDAEWTVLEPMLPPVKAGTPNGGRPPKFTRREIVDAIRYVLRTGCQWRMVPGDMPQWSSVYAYFRNWSRDGTWIRVHDRMRTASRLADGRNAEPTAAVIDSQSVKTTERGASRLRRRQKNRGSQASHPG